jgi:hypothetical protein
MPRIVYHLDFLRANPDIKIMVSRAGWFLIYFSMFLLWYLMLRGEWWSTPLFVTLLRRCVVICTYAYMRHMCVVSERLCPDICCAAFTVHLVRLRR